VSYSLYVGQGFVLEAGSTLVSYLVGSFSKEAFYYNALQVVLFDVAGNPQLMRNCAPADREMKFLLEGLSTSPISL